MSSKPVQRTDAILSLCVFLSGLSALIYQVAWQRILVLLVGAGLPALTIVICVFMAGLAIGSLAAARRSKTMSSPLKVYSYLELALGAIGFLIPWATTRTFELLLGAISTLTEAVCHQNVVNVLTTVEGTIFVNLLLLTAISILLLAPTILMGATLPTAVQAITRQGENHNGGMVASLYFINVLGAAIGSLAAAFCLMPVIGINNTVRVAAVINLLASLMLQFLHRLGVDKETTESSAGAAASKNAVQAARDAEDSTAKAAWEKTPEGKDSFGDGYMTVRLLAWLVALCSALSLSMEVAWTRLFSLVLGSSTYALGAVLAFCLAGIAAGAWAAGKLLPLVRHRLLQLCTLLALSSVVTAVQLFLIAELPWYLNTLERTFSQIQSPFAIYIFVRVVLVAALALPQSAVAGAVLPLALGFAVRERATAGHSTGVLLCASTVGSIVGTILAGCLLIPQAVPLLDRLGPSGIQGTIIIVGAAQMLIALFLFYKCGGFSSDHCPLFGAKNKVPKQMTRSAVLVITAFLLLSVHPKWQPSVMSSGISFLALPSLPALARQEFGVLLQENKGNGSHLLYYKEGMTTTVTVGLVPPNNVVCLKNDGKIEAALPINPQWPTPASDEPTQVLLGAVPALIAPVKAKTAFLVGYGSGTTAGAILTDPDIESLVIAEIEPAVYAADHYFNATNNRPLREEWKHSGRVKALAADARNLLVMAPEKYDLIVSQPAEPWVSGSTDLYSLEFWKLAKTKLSAHGVFCQWIQLYSIDPKYLAVVLRTFHDVFPNLVLFHQKRAGELIVVGFHDGNDQIEPSQVAARMNDPHWRQLLKRAGIDCAHDLLSTAVGDNLSVTRFCMQQAVRYDLARMNSDNNLLIEYALPPELLVEGDVIAKNLKALGIDETLTDPARQQSSTPNKAGESK